MDASVEPSAPIHVLARRCALVAAAAVLALLALSGATQASRPPDWQGDFESADLTQWDAVQEVAAGRVTIEQSNVRQGRYAARFEVRRGDHWAGLAGERAEVTKTVGETAGDESYWAWSTYFPASFASDPTAGFQMFTQWHSSSNTDPSGVTFQVAGDRLVVRVAGGASRQRWRQYDLGPLVRSAWQDFVMHVRWGSGGDGVIDIWRDGTLVVSHAVGPNIGTGLSTYVKQGFYRPSTANTTVVYEDAMRYGTTMADVTTPFSLAFVGRTHVASARVWFRLGSFARTTVSVALVGPAGRTIARSRDIVTNGRGEAWGSVACRQMCSRLPRHLRLVARAAVDSSLPGSARVAMATVTR
jgi:hypothetical protein